MKVPIVFVCPWFGPDIPGGAERAARELVRNLHLNGCDVSVLTTTARDFYSWDHYYDAGHYDFEGVSVQRCAVDPRNAAAFDRVNGMLLQGRPISAWEERQFLTNIVKSEALNRYLARHYHDALYIFTPYMFGTTFWGVRLVPERAVLLPCLHDEPYLYLPRFKDMLKRAKGLFFYSEGEARLAEEILGQNRFHRVLGLGINETPVPSDQDIDEFRERHGLDRPFLFLPGRKQPEKNTNLAIEYFSIFLDSISGDRPILVLSGPGEVSIPETLEDAIRDLGFLSQKDLETATAAAAAVLIPSERESFSFTMFEAWAASTPVLVHHNCLATRLPVENSGGGLTFTDQQTFSKNLQHLLEENRASNDLRGQQGLTWLRENNTWEVVIQRFNTYVEEIL